RTVSPGIRMRSRGSDAKSINRAKCHDARESALDSACPGKGASLILPFHANRIQQKKQRAEPTPAPPGTSIARLSSFVGEGDNGIVACGPQRRVDGTRGSSYECEYDSRKYPRR